MIRNPFTENYKLKVCRDFSGDWVLKYKKKDSRWPFWKRVKVYSFTYNKLIRESWAEKYDAERFADIVLQYSSIKYFYERELQKKRDRKKAKEAIRRMKRKRNEPIIYE